MRERLGLGLGLGCGLEIGYAPPGATLHQVRKSEMTQAMDDADYHRIFAETGTNTLEVALGA